MNIYSLCCPHQFFNSRRWIKKNHTKSYSLSCFLNVKLFSQCYFITPLPEKYSKLSYKKIFWIFLWSENKKKKKNKIKKKSRLLILWRKAVFYKAPVMMPSTIWHYFTVQKQCRARRRFLQGNIYTYWKSMRGDSPNLVCEINLQKCCQAEYTYILAQGFIFM